MTRDWKRLGDAIKARREELGLTTQQTLADAAGVTRQTIQSLEAGKERTRMPASIGGIETALKWEPGTAARILTEGASAQNGVTGRLAEGMPGRVVQELSTGQVVDTEVVELTLPGLPVRLVAILKQDSRDAELTPSEMARVLEEWSRMQRALRGIADDSGGSPNAH